MEDRLARLLGDRPIRIERPPGGHTRATRGLVTLTSGGKVFAKLAKDERTATALRSEHAIYSALAGDWIPRLIAWEDGPHPILVLEDLSAFQWPPPWPQDIEQVLTTLAEVAATKLPFEVGTMERLATSPWVEILEDPDPTIALGVVDREWIDRFGPMLIERSSTIDLAGDDLIHADLGAENLCFTDRGPVIVDWEFVTRGNRYLDVATIMLDYRLSGGRPPDGALPDAGAWAALLAGFMGVQAARPPPAWAEDGPRLRDLQCRAFAGAIEWAIHELAT